MRFKKILAITCTTCFIIFAAVILILISLLLKTPNEVHKEIGDNSGITSDLVSLGSGGNINITLEGGGDIIVYITESIPEKNSDTLEEVAIPPLSGIARQNYNYNRNNQPIYLLENSVLTYELLVHGPRLHSCPAQLFFFDNYESYSNFINYASYEAIAFSPCFGFSDTWSYNITKSSIVYAAIAIDDNVTVTANVSGTRFYYNTTNLAYPSSCKYPLNGHNLSCVINTKICSTKYALMAASNMMKVKYNSNWLQLPCSAQIISIVLLTSICIVILVISIFCVVAFVWHQYNDHEERVQHIESEPIDTCSRTTEQSEPTGSSCITQSTEQSEPTGSRCITQSTEQSEPTGSRCITQSTEQSEPTGSRCRSQDTESSDEAETITLLH